MKNRITRPLISLAILLGMSAAAHAARIEMGDVDIDISTTVSASASVRTSEQNCEYISVFNGGCTAPNGTDYDVNADDGNVNVERGDFIAAPVKIISEANAKWDNLGVFVRAKAFYDYVGDKVVPSRPAIRSAANSMTSSAATRRSIFKAGSSISSTLSPMAISSSPTCRPPSVSAVRRSTGVKAFSSPVAFPPICRSTCRRWCVRASN